MPRPYETENSGTALRQTWETDQAEIFASSSLGSRST
jgi:hypothetical protein